MELCSNMQILTAKEDLLHYSMRKLNYQREDFDTYTKACVYAIIENKSFKREIKLLKFNCANSNSV